MKRTIALLLLLAMMILTACQNGTGTQDSTDSGTGLITGIGSETTGDSTSTPSEFQDAVGVVGTISAQVDGNNIAVNTGDIKFDILWKIATGYRVDAGSLLLSKAGSDAKIAESSDTRISAINSWSKNNASVTSDYHLASDGITVSQTTTVSGGSIGGSTFCIRLEDDYNVIVPVQNGVRLSKEHPKLYGSNSYRAVYGEHSAIQMQMLVLEGENGGVVIYADDDNTQFKAIRTEYSSGSFNITIESIPQAPFTQYTTYEAIDWKIIPYKGDWTSAAAIYRDYVREKFSLDETDTYRPDWVDDIQMFVLTDMHDKNELSTLASLVDASKVLLQVPDWRSNLYDVNWPDYTPQKELKDMIEYAHSLGFKVQLHCNMNGCQMELEEYQQVKQYHIIKPNGSKHTEDFSDASGRRYVFAHINPASSEWRKIVINNLVEAVKETGADAIHLDQSLLSYNDANGLVDGMTTLQGNVLYHKELIEALPEGIAIGGEGINDFNARYASFLQSHVYGTDSGNKTWDDAQGEQIVPLTTAVYTDIKTYQWPGLPQASAEDYYLSWYRFGTAIGHFPTLMRENPTTLKKDTPVLKMVLNEANWFMEYEPIRVFSNWDDDTIMRWYLNNGIYARMKRTDTGWVLLADENDETSVVTQIVHGVTKAEVTGCIDGCLAYDDSCYYGLDPDRYYVVLNKDKIAGETHITSLTPNVVVEQWVQKDGYLQLSFTTKSTSLKKINLTLSCREEIADVYTRSGEVTCTPAGDHLYDISLPVGETLYLIYDGGSSTALPINFYSQTQLAYYVDTNGKYTITDTTEKATGSFAGQLRKKITVKVPAKRMNCLEYIVSLPEKDNMKLTLMVGASSQLRTDLPVSIQINGKTVWEGQVSEPNTVQDITINLDEYKGQILFLTFLADGRELNGITHEIVWINPIIQVKK